MRMQWDIVCGTVLMGQRGQSTEREGGAWEKGEGPGNEQKGLPTDNTKSRFSKALATVVFTVQELVIPMLKNSGLSQGS